MDATTYSMRLAAWQRSIARSLLWAAISCVEDAASNDVAGSCSRPSARSDESAARCCARPADFVGLPAAGRVRATGPACSLLSVGGARRIAYAP